MRPRRRSNGRPRPVRRHVASTFGKDTWNGNNGLAEPGALRGSPGGRRGPAGSPDRLAIERARWSGSGRSALGRGFREPSGRSAAGSRRQPVHRAPLQACPHRGPFAAGGAPLLVVGLGAGDERRGVQRAGSVGPAARHRQDLGSGRHSGQARAAVARRADAHGPAAASGAEDSGRLLFVARDHGNRPAFAGLVRRQPAELSAAGPRDSARGPAAGDRRRLRLDDHRPGLPQRPVARPGVGRAVRGCRSAVRSRPGHSVRRVTTIRGLGQSGCRPLAAGTETHGYRRHLAADGNRRRTECFVGRRPVSAETVGQHARRRGVRRPDRPDHDLEPGRRTADGHCRGRGSSAVVAAPAGRPARRARIDDRRPRLPDHASDRKWDPVAAAVHHSRPQRTAGRGRYPRYAGARQRRRVARRGNYAARRLARGLAGEALPELARAGDQGPIDAGGQSVRVRQYAQAVRRSPSRCAACPAA